MQQVIEWSSENNNKGVIRSIGLMTFLYSKLFEELYISFYYESKHDLKIGSYQITGEMKYARKIYEETTLLRTYRCFRR